LFAPVFFSQKIKITKKNSTHVSLTPLFGYGGVDAGSPQNNFRSD